MEVGIVPGRFEGFMGFGGMETFLLRQDFEISWFFIRRKFVYLDPFEL